MALLAVGCWLVGVGNAAAHTALVSSDPAEGATVTTVPATVTLSFSEDINPAFATVVINGSDGRNWVTEAAQVAGFQVRVAMQPDAPAGADYTVAYRVVSADGHPVSGSFTFTIASAPNAVQTSPPSTTAASPTTSEATSAAPPTEEGPLGSDTKTSIITAGGVGLLLGAVIAFWQSRRHRRSDMSEDDSPSS